MYTYEYNLINDGQLKKDCTLIIFLGNNVIESRIVQFNKDATQEELDNYANSIIEYLQGLE